MRMVVRLDCACFRSEEVFVQPVICFCFEPNIALLVAIMSGSFLRE